MNIPAIRAHLKKAAAREPEELRPLINLLSKQLSSAGRGTGDDRKALWPEIEKNMTNIERARGGNGR